MDVRILQNCVDNCVTYVSEKYEQVGPVHLNEILKGLEGKEMRKNGEQ